jgi:large subunit ribosomal protein L5
MSGIQTFIFINLNRMLKDKYVKEIIPALKEKLEIANIMEVPKVEKVVLNM